MAARRYATRRSSSIRPGLGIVEISLAVSVIVGLLFVTARVMTMDAPHAVAKVHDTDTVVVKTETTPLAADGAQTRMP